MNVLPKKPQNSPKVDRTQLMQIGGSKISSLILAVSVSLAFFIILFLWGFWRNGVYALGVNFSVFLLGIIAIFFLSGKKRILDLGILLWLVPIILIAISYSIYENPFLKVVSLFAFFMSLMVFSNYSMAKAENRQKMPLLKRFLFPKFEFLLNWMKASDEIGRLSKFGKINTGLIMKMIFGFLIFVCIAAFVILPLLSSADKEFAEKISQFADFIFRTISVETLLKIMVFILSSVFFVGFGMSIREKKYLISEKEAQMDSIVSGIVLAGILAIYLLFLWVQIGHFWTNDLPEKFKETERLVKSGFWQLMIVSMINILFFLVYYRKTNRVVQSILAVFSVASVMILVSAGQRMALYVTFYGLSYEKFFASYAVLYCLFLFIGLFVFLLKKERCDILKFTLLLLLWMYGVLAVFPVERTIFYSNIKLKERIDSRIHLRELKMLSSDVLADVATHSRNGVLVDDDWNFWIDRNKKELSSKKWYEKNFSNLVNKAQMSGFE